MSQSATNWALNTRDQASRWNCETYPQPIRAPRSGGAALRMAIPLRFSGVRVFELEVADCELDSTPSLGSTLLSFVIGCWSLVSGAELWCPVLGRSPALARPTPSSLQTEPR